MLRRPIISAVLLGAATYALIALLVTALPASATIGVITDYVALPGAFVASLVYPEGPHTGPGVGVRWAVLVVISNFVIYVVFWYLCLVATRWITARHVHS